MTRRMSVGRASGVATLAVRGAAVRSALARGAVVSAAVLGVVVLAMVGGCTAGSRAGSNADSNTGSLADPGSDQVRVVEAACGTCQFGMSGSGCPLAVRIDGVSYLVAGSDIDAHGDAHAADGLCNAIRQARVTGRVDGERFVATRMELLPVDTGR